MQTKCLKFSFKCSQVHAAAAVASAVTETPSNKWKLFQFSQFNLIHRNGHFIRQTISCCQYFKISSQNDVDTKCELIFVYFLQYIYGMSCFRMLRSHLCNAQFNSIELEFLMRLSRFEQLVLRLFWSSFAY